jgi:hypothetical protein
LTAAQILAALQLAQSLYSGASAAYAAIKADLDAATQAEINAAIASSGTALDTARAQIDKDAVG